MYASEAMIELSATSAPPERSERLPAFFLARLKRLKGLAPEYEAMLSAQEWRLVRRAIFSTYLDCIALGLHAEAHAILREPGDWDSDLGHDRRAPVPVFEVRPGL